MSDTFTFRPISPVDIPRLHRWRNLPHVSQWWDPPNPDYALAQDEYRSYMRPNSGVDAYIVQHAGQPFGYIQKWQVAQFPDYNPHVSLHAETVGVDVFIGEPDALHKGYGPRLMRAFLRDYVFSEPNVPDCIIDPLPENQAAIRAYEKVGFVHEKTFVHDGKSVYLMRLRRENFNSA